MRSLPSFFRWVAGCIVGTASFLDGMDHIDLGVRVTAVRDNEFLTVVASIFHGKARSLLNRSTVEGTGQRRLPPFHDPAWNMSGFDPASIDMRIGWAAAETMA